MRTLTLTTLITALALAGCNDEGVQTTESDSGATEATSPATNSPATEPDLTTTDGFQLVCKPGEASCEDDATARVCKKTGLSYETKACGNYQTCLDGDCIGPCEQAAENPTSLGCEFLALRVQSHNPVEFDDAMIVGNTDLKRTAEVQLYFTPNNTRTEEPIGDPVLLAPSETHVFTVGNQRISLASDTRTGGVYRVQSDIPIAAYLHSTLVNDASNDASLLLPTATLRRNYVAASYPGFVDANKPDDVNGRPSFFMAIALYDDTTVTWTPKADTYGNGFSIPPVAPGEVGTVTLNRHDVVQVGASSTVNLDYPKHDVSGTVVEADKNVWLLSGTDCAFVPYGTGYCNHLQEQMLPLEYWGKKYVGAHSPTRSTEEHYWRLYAGEDNTKIALTSNSASFKPPPVILERRGDYFELPVPNGVSMIFQGTKPFMPVQYLAGNIATGKVSGDPAMYQMIPVEQWLERYAFVTGVNYLDQYAQITRVKGGADITINGELVTDYYFISGEGLDNQYEIADVKLPQDDLSQPQSFFLESAEPFSVVVIGFNDAPNSSAYAYPGGMRLKPLYQP